MDTLPNDLLLLIGNFLDAKRSIDLHLHTNNKVFECQPTLSADEAARTLNWRWINTYLQNNYISFYVSAGKFKCNDVIAIVFKDPRLWKYILEGYAVGGHLEDFKLLWTLGGFEYANLAYLSTLAMDNNNFEIVKFCIDEGNKYPAVSIKNHIANIIFNTHNGEVPIEMIEYIYNLRCGIYTNRMQMWATRTNRVDVVEYLLSHEPNSAKTVFETALYSKNLDMIQMSLPHMTEKNIDIVISDVIRGIHYKINPHLKVEELKFLVEEQIISKKYILDLCKTYNMDDVYKYISW